jgi:hypothetical protein
MKKENSYVDIMSIYLATFLNYLNNSAHCFKIQNWRPGLKVDMKLTLLTVFIITVSLCRAIMDSSTDFINI